MNILGLLLFCDAIVVELDALLLVLSGTKKLGQIQCNTWYKKWENITGKQGGKTLKTKQQQNNEFWFCAGIY